MGYNTNTKVTLSPRSVTEHVALVSPLLHQLVRPPSCYSGTYRSQILRRWTGLKKQNSYQVSRKSMKWFVKMETDPWSHILIKTTDINTGRHSVRERLSNLIYFIHNYFSTINIPTRLQKNSDVPIFLRWFCFLSDCVHARTHMHTHTQTLKLLVFTLERRTQNYKYNRRWVLFQPSEHCDSPYTPHVEEQTVSMWLLCTRVTQRIAVCISLRVLIDLSL